MPSPATIRKVVDEVRKREANYRYFFSRLDSPDWIIPLKQASPPFFSDPPQSVRHEGYVSFPTWPESQYLVRMAPRDPELVCSILLELPLTDNVRVHEDVIEAALQLPPPLAARLARREAEWVRSESVLYLHSGDLLGRLVARLAQVGETDAALKLAVALLELSPDQERARPPSNDDDMETYLPFDPEVTPKIDPWNYHQILTRDIPPLVDSARCRALDLLCDLLETAVRYHLPAGLREPPTDLSPTWRFAVEDHGENEDHSIRDHLVEAVRNSSENLAARSAEAFTTVIARLESRPWRIFERIALHVARRLRLLCPERAEELALRRTLLERHDHEYILLLRDCFQEFSDAAQRKLIHWIELGPNLNEFRHRFRDAYGQEPEKGEVQAYIARWKKRRLAPLREHLRPDLIERYEGLLGPIPSTDDVELPHGHIRTGWMGPTSPTSTEELLRLDDDALIEYLRTWRPRPGLDEPTLSDLAVCLEAAVVEDPRRFARLAPRLTGLRPVCVGGVLSGFRELAGRNVELSWQPVLELALWAAGQEESASREDVEAELRGETSSWRGPKLEIAQLLQQGLTEGRQGPPRDLGSLVWNVLRLLLEDPDPQPEREDRSGGAQMDPATFSLNCVRGRAFHCLFYYAFWRVRSGGFARDPESDSYRCFNDLAEVANVLDAHLDPAKEPSASVRSVYGQRFPQIASLDDRRAKEWHEKIFSLRSPEDELGMRAWESYLIFNPASVKVYQILTDIYTWSIGHLDELSQRKLLGKDAESALGDHLVMLFSWGRLDGDLEQSLLGHYLRNANPNACGNVLEGMGRKLKNTWGEIPRDARERLKRLFDFWFAMVTEELGRNNLQEKASAFGWWYISGKFDEEWAIGTLLEVLRVVKYIEPEREVVDRLAASDDNLLETALRCGSIIVENHKDRWRTHLVRKSLYQLLERARNHGERAVRDSAFALINKLGAMGYFEFRRLI